MVKVASSKDGQIPVGARLTRINNHEIGDSLEFQYYNDESSTRNVVIEYNGTGKNVLYRPGQKIAIALEPPHYRQCMNRCSFCFINGLPAGLRKELYFRDDDYRLSFLFGNFLSLTNISQEDISRIGRLRLSPLYVSVHTTDPALRVSLFKNEKAAYIYDHLKALADENIKLHCQIVVIPGMTDGQGLVNTIEQLARLYPAVNSIGIVPVGKTKHLRGIRLVPPRLSRSIIESVHAMHARFRKKFTRGLVYLADEFFIRAGHPIPEKSYYDDLPQYENGIGMARCLLEEIDQIKNVKKSKGTYLILTSTSAHPFLKTLRSRLAPYLHVDVEAVANDFFGKTVTVSGLMCAQDIGRSIMRHGKKYDRVILPPNCVNDAGQFLDGDKVIAGHAFVSPTTIKELLKCLQ
jgi:putative radical SAM enzyme (TIGR03279 family)